MKIELKTITVSKDHLIKYPFNPRKKVDPKAIEKLKVLILAHGFRNHLEVWKNSDGQYEILCGNHRFEAAVLAGINDFPCTVYEGTKEMAAARVISDNKSSEWTEYDIIMLKDMLIELDDGDFDLSSTGFDESELKDLIDWDGEQEGLTDQDAIPDVSASEITKPGDLIILGAHRLLCGDATNREDVDLLINGDKPDLVFTDPPYGIDVVQGSKVGGGGPTKFGKIGGGKIVDAKTYKAIKGDDTTDVAGCFYSLMKEIGFSRIVLWGGNYFTDFLPPSRCWYVWNKEMTGNFSEAEMAWTSFEKGGVKIFKHLWNGLSREGERKEELKSRVHPTQKPVGLFSEIFKKLVHISTVLDPFLGSGSTLIACEKTGKKCYGMEIDPQYCDVIVKRWEDYTGEEAVRP